MIALGPLQLGAFVPPLRDRHETVRAPGLRRPLRLWYASDLHLRARIAAAVSEALLDSARRAAPRVVLLGGDLVDRASGLEPLRDLVAKLSRIAPVLAVAGNHEAWLGLERVAAAVREGGGRFGEGRVLTDEGLALAVRPHEPADPRAGYRVLVAHDPAVFPRAAEQGFGLVLAGHLHGSQVHLFERRGRSYPGALFYRWNGPRFRRGASTLLVSRGVADTLPLRFRCPRELLVCELVPAEAQEPPAGEVDAAAPGRREG